MMRFPGKAGLLATPFFLLSLSLPASAGELKQFAMHYTSGMKGEECALTKRFSKTDKKIISIPGLLDANGCLVSMPHKDFEDQFRFCYLAGFGLYEVDNPEMVECLTEKRGDDYIFFANGGLDKGVAQVMCYFTCIANDEK